MDWLNKYGLHKFGATESVNIIDSSKIQTYQTCPRQFMFEHILGWRFDRSRHDLIFGQAWHLAMEQMLKDYAEDKKYKKVEAAYAKFEELYRKYYTTETDMDLAPKNPGTALAMLHEYARTYSYDNFGVVHTEASGLTPISNERFVSFRLDAVIDLGKDKGLAILEHKTTKYLSSTWQEQWPNKFQINLYSHALEVQFNEPVYGIIVNGAVFRKSGGEFIRAVMRKSPDMKEFWIGQFNAWFDMIEADLERMQDSINKPTLEAFPLNGESCTKYNRACPYIDFCRVWANPLHHCEETPIGFIKEYWDPRREE